jgi:glycosyltransferase involved in cell wall biosynthesis
MKHDLLIIIPAYNEAENIKNTIAHIGQFAPDYDYIIVNDGSSDHTLDICREKHYPVINLPIHVGLTHAVKAGMMYAFEKGYGYAIQFDSDGQHDARRIAPLYNAVRSGECDIAIGSRYLNAAPKLSMRVVGSRILSFLIKLSAKQRLTDPTSGMRLYNRRIIGLFARVANINPEPDTISYLIRCGVRVKEVPVEMMERTNGESMFSSMSSVDYMIRIAFSLLFVQWFRKRDVLL